MSKKKSNSTTSLGSSAFCVPPIPEKVAARKASGHTCHHELSSSQDTLQAISPALNAVTTEILQMLPEPRDLVHSLLLLSIDLLELIFISLSSLLA